jgi:hypothetical protein
MDALATIARVRRVCSKGLIAMGGCIAATALAAPAAQADFGISSFEGSTSIDGEFSRQAGAHPDLSLGLRFPVKNTPEGEVADGEVKTVAVDLPPGLVSNPTAAPTCTNAQLVGGSGGKGAICPIGSQVGMAYISTESTPGLPPQYAVPLYNLVAPNDLPALFGFNVEGAVVRVEPQVRAGDSGTSVAVPSISQALTVVAARLTLWGVPADPSHDADRFLGDSQFGDKNHPSPSARLPFISSPTSCPGSPAQFTAEADSWQSPGVFSHASLDADAEGTPFVFMGCERLYFDPSILPRFGTHRAASPTGMDIDISVPQSRDPYGLSSADVRRTVIALPKGMSVSMSAAAALGSCAPNQIKLGSNEAPACPDSSTIGTVRIDTPLLDEALKGEVILAKPNDNPFGSLLALYLSVRGPGFYLKLPARVDADPGTGRLTLTIDDTPQWPFSQMHLDLRGGPTAPLLTPSTCGTYFSHAEITSWASPVPVPFDTPMVIDEECAGKGGFDPAFQAGVTDPVAGEPSPFVLRLSRRDGDQNLARIEATLPRGELAKLAGVPVCDDARVAVGACPASSRVGTSTVVIGAGAFPLFIPQPGNIPSPLYLAGPYRGAPYSFLLKIPAQAGPFDLGTVLSRVAIRIDPRTAQASVVTDPLPQILAGIPLPYRDVRISIDRPGFMQNPTSCARTAVNGVFTSSQGGTARRSAPFQVGNCAGLGFRPRISMRFIGPTHRGAHPKFRTVLRPREGDANIGRLAITLPGTEFLENTHIRKVCSAARYAAERCPDGSVYGYAKVWTPLLDRPLQGPVYLRSSSHKLPDLAASLDGEMHIDIAGRIDSVGARIRSTFRALPDAQISKFVVTMRGGRKGLLVNNTELCRTTPRARAQFDGKNGKRHDANPIVKTECADQQRK